MTDQVTNDAWGDADKAQPPTYSHFGQISIVADNVIWPKGTQLRDCPPYSPDVHKPDQRRVRITIMATPLPGRTNPFPHERVVPITSREWAAVTLPSLKALDISGRDLDGKWAHYEFAKARTYKDKQGEVKDATSFKFLAIYQTEPEAIAAAAAFFGSEPEPEDEPLPWDGDDAPATPAPAATAAPPVDENRQTMARFLPALWAQSGNDVIEFTKILASQPMLAELFDAQSPEVINVISGKPPF